MKLFLSITTVIFLCFSLIGISPFKMTKLLLSLEKDAMTCEQRQLPDSAADFVRSLKKKGYNTNQILESLSKNGYYETRIHPPAPYDSFSPLDKAEVVKVVMIGDNYPYCIIKDMGIANRSVVSFSVDKETNIVRFDGQK